MPIEKTQALLLRAIPYLNFQIVHLFSPEGLLSLVVKKKELLPYTTPFSLGEWVYKRGKETLHTCVDIAILDTFPSLKTNYSRLSHAGQLAQEILSSQLPEKKESAPLYALACVYLQRLEHTKNPEALLASFRMKRLLYDGLLHLSLTCSQCESPTTHLYEGESLCATHAPLFGTRFSSEELETLHTLVCAKQFDPLEKLSSLLCRNALTKLHKGSP